MGYKRDIGIDLHIHSTASDGTFSPAQIVNHAVALHIKAIAITDHDTVAGAKEAIEEAINIDPPPQIIFFTGVEISAAFPVPFTLPGSLHILGYCIDIDNSALNALLLQQQHARRDRNPRIIRRLNELGIDIDINGFHQQHETGLLGRPHIAQWLVSKGVVESIDAAFDRFLGKGKAAYIEKPRVACQDAIASILNAGGIPVLAHPGLIQLPRDEMFIELIQCLRDIGLQGLEAYYPKHTKKQTQQFIDVACQYNFIITGGTDFHGTLTPDIQMGSGYGNFFVPHELMKPLELRTQQAECTT